MNLKKIDAPDAELDGKLECNSAKPVCGIVRPIAGIEELAESHWLEVHDILCDAIKDSGFEPKLVSHASESGVIQKRIIENLYFSELVVCDISAKNPNVMLELGMRLAFDKPTIIVKDYETSFSFDISPIEHVLYRRDLRFGDVVRFKSELSKKIESTHKKSKTDENYSTFLRSFGDFKVAKLEKKMVAGEELVIDRLDYIASVLSKLDTKKDTADAWTGLIGSTATSNKARKSLLLVAETPKQYLGLTVALHFASLSEQFSSAVVEQEVIHGKIYAKIFVSTMDEVKSIESSLRRIGYEKINVKTVDLKDII